jgi:PDZ domain-containing secreted protein
MKLSAKFLKNVANVNTFQYADQWDMAEGSSQRLYFQIVDKLKDDLRYMSQATVIDSVTVTFLSIDDESEIVKTAVQPFADDKSIWYIDLTATEVPNSGAVKFSITEDGVTKTFRVAQAIVVDLLEAGGC